MLPYIHNIIGIPVFQHSLSNGLRRMFFICEHAYHSRPFDEGSVKFLPGTPRQRDNLHIVVRHQQAVGQQLEGVERRKQLYLRIRHHALDGICDAKEKGIARSKNHNK